MHSLNSTNSGESHAPYSQINHVNHFNFSIINNSPGNNTNPVFNATTNLSDSLHSIIKANVPYLGTPKTNTTKVSALLLSGLLPSATQKYHLPQEAPFT